MCELWCKDLEEKLAKVSSIYEMEFPIVSTKELPEVSKVNRFISALAVYRRLQNEYIYLCKKGVLTMRVLELGRALILQKHLIDELH